MEIKKAGRSDFPEILGLIRKEFPYLERDMGGTVEKIKSGRISIFKAVENGRLLGFVETEFLEEGIARINGLSVKEESQGKGIGKLLLEYAIAYLKKNGIGRVLLLVKQSNEKAKKLYSGKGFEFIGLYHRKLDNEIVEEMELDFFTGQPSYVS